MKLLVAVDGSDHSARAVEYVAGLMDTYKTVPEVLLINVHAPVASARVRSYVGKEALDNYYREECEAALEPARKQLTAKGVAFTAVTLVGDVGSEIARYATEKGCDMIVIGTHGHNAVSNLVMGSVATRVLSESKVPVLMIK